MMELQKLIDGLKSHRNGAASYESVDEAIRVLEAMRDIDSQKVCNGLDCFVNHVNGPYRDDCRKAGCEYLKAGDCEMMVMSDALSLIRQQQARIAELEAGQKWISVKDRLPDAAGYECLVCAVNENYNQTHVFTAHTGYGEPGWWTGNVNYMSRATSPSDNRLHPALNVTHWMPLPEPPKEEEHATD